MAGNTSNISFRVDTDIKNQAESVLAELGMNMTTAFNIFLRQTIRERGIPFMINASKPNKETIEAMLEAEKIAKDPNVKGYRNIDLMFEDILNDKI
jgi:DNA-damage-inducible protein J